MRLLRILPGLLLTAALFLPRAGTAQDAKGPANRDQLDRLNYYTLYDAKGNTVGEGFIQSERKKGDGDQGEYVRKDYSFSWKDVSEKFTISMNARPDGAPLASTYRNDVNEKAKSKYELSYEGNKITYSILTSIGSYNGDTNVAAVYPLDLFLSERAVAEGNWADGHVIRVHKFNPQSKSVVDVRYTLKKDKTPHNLALETVDTYTLTVGDDAKSDDYFYLIKTLTLDRDGLVYEITFGNGQKVELKVSNTPTDVDTDYYDILDARNKKTGFGSISAQPKTFDGKDAVEITQQARQILNNNLVRSETRALFLTLPEHKLVNFERKVYVKSTLARNITGELIDDKVELKWTHYSPQEKKGQQSLDLPANAYPVFLLPVYFKKFSMQAGVKYSFYDLTDSQNEKSPYSIELTQYTCGTLKEIEYLEGHKVTVFEMKAPHELGTLGCLVSKEGKIYRSDMPVSGVLVAWQKTSKEKAENFRPEEDLPFWDEFNRFHFKMGFRRDPFEPPVRAPKKTAGGTEEKFPSHDEEQKKIDELMKKYSDLEAALQAQEAAKASQLLGEIDSMFKSKFYWPDLRERMMSVKHEVDRLKEQYKKVVEAAERIKVEQAMASLREALNQMKRRFESGEYELVFKAQDAIRDQIKRDENMFSQFQSSQEECRQILAAATKYFERATSIKEFNEHASEIKVTGVVVEEGASVAIINNVNIVQVKDEALVIKSPEGKVLGVVTVAKIEPLGVTFEYKGELITKGFEPLQASGSAKDGQKAPKQAPPKKGK